MMVSQAARMCFLPRLDVDDFAPRLSFFFNSHKSISLEEIANFRASRKSMVSADDSERFHAKNSRGRNNCVSHTQTGGLFPPPHRADGPSPG